MKVTLGSKKLFREGFPKFLVTVQLAERHSNRELVIPPSRLSEIEAKGMIPIIYRLYSLALIYRLDMREILKP